MLLRGANLKAKLRLDYENCVDFNGTRVWDCVCEAKYDLCLCLYIVVICVCLCMCIYYVLCLSLTL